MIAPSHAVQRAQTIAVFLRGVRACRDASGLSAPGDFCRPRRAVSGSEVQRLLDIRDAGADGGVNVSMPPLCNGVTGSGMRTPCSTVKPLDRSYEQTWHDAGWRRLHPATLEQRSRPRRPVPLCFSLAQPTLLRRAGRLRWKNPPPQRGGVRGGERPRADVMQ